jgi:hypothetical protein
MSELFSEYFLCRKFLKETIYAIQQSFGKSTLHEWHATRLCNNFFFLYFSFTKREETVLDVEHCIVGP